jgi:hypothetical protein
MLRHKHIDWLVSDLAAPCHCCFVSPVNKVGPQCNQLRELSTAKVVPPCDPASLTMLCVIP